MRRRSYCEGVLAIEMKKKIPSLYSTIISDYYGTQVYFFFFAMLLCLYDIISCDAINVKNFREILRYLF